MFLEKVETSKVFVRDCSVASPYALLLFGGNVTVQHDRGTVAVDDWIRFTAPAKVGVLARELRKELDHLLFLKVRAPRQAHSDRCAVLRTDAVLVAMLMRCALQSGAARHCGAAEDRGRGVMAR